MNEAPMCSSSILSPYWRGSSAIWHIGEGLSEIAEKLKQLEVAYDNREERLEQFYELNPHFLDNDELLVKSSEYWEIVSPFANLREQIKLRVERTIVMAAIEAENNINMVCVYNFRREMTEIIEKLSPTEKFVMLGSILTNRNVKGVAEYAQLQALMKYRNAFAHGHNTDRPVKTLHHNHLIHPEKYSEFPEELEKLKELVGGFFKVNSFVRSMSKNEYAKGESGDEEDLKPILEEIEANMLIWVN